jgi:hypothetical protein
MPRRFIRGARSKAVAQGFRSGLELEMGNWMSAHGLCGEFESERCKMTYMIPETKHRYTCDFILEKTDGTLMFIETKGLWEAKDRQKMLLLRSQHPDMDIRIVFQGDPYKKYIGKKGGTSYADVCSGRARRSGGFDWPNFTIPFCWGDTGTKNTRHANMLPEQWMEECKGFVGHTLKFRKGDLL